MKRGEELKPEIERAIKESRASIVVLSKNYATSTWCLDELRLILGQRRECNHFVLPVFYHVNPSDVKKQQNSFAIQVQSSGRWTQHIVNLWKAALTMVSILIGFVFLRPTSNTSNVEEQRNSFLIKVQSSGRWTEDNVNLWKAALTEVANLSGLVLSGPETKFLKKIIDTIDKELDLKPVKLPSNLTGMDTRYKDISSWLEQLDAPFLIICGMGGSGKTTLAKYILYSNWRKFENISFVEDIASRCKEPHDLLQLQKKLLQDILGGKKRKIPSVCQGTCSIEEALQTKRSLIVLDDIDEQRKLAALLGSGKINTQCKIIITTEVLNATQWFDSSDWRYRKYKMELLDPDESLEVLSLYAFRSKTPMEGFEELAVEALQYCGGNPLALGVLGSALYVSEEDTANGNSIPVWKSTLSLLEKEMYPEIRHILVRSYDSLPHNHKELFLHIACFFVGKDMDYVVKILEPDYSALAGIKTLTNRCLLSVSPNKKLMMHRLLQEMGRRIVDEQSPNNPAKRSRLWRDWESYEVLRKGEGSKAMEGLALEMQMLREELYPLQPFSDPNTDSLTKMDNLKLLQLNDVQITGSYKNFSKNLKWLSWHRFHLTEIPSDLFMGNVVAIDMSYSNLVVFEPPMVLKSLQILNLKDSHNLFEIRNVSRVPNLETLVLWNCRSLTHVCESIGSLKSLALLNMTGCESLCSSSLGGLGASTGGESTEQPTFSLPHSLERLFLNDCDLECTDYFPLSFDVQLSLQYLNLAYGLFELLPNYNHLTNLRVLDLSFCSRLKRLLCLPRTLAELYTYYCESLEKITFESQRFTLQEFGYEGCLNLLEIEGFIKLVPLAKLDEADLGHMKWLKEYQNHEVCLIGDDELTTGRSYCIQMLYEFDIMSTSLLEIKDPNVTPEFISESPSLSFFLPLCPKNRRLKGLNVSFLYTISGKDWVWFAKISTSNGVDLMYNPKVFGKPAFGEVAIWLSYWPIGNTLNIGDKVDVSIAVISGLEVRECGASLVYYDDQVAKDLLENNMGCAEILGGDLSGFQLNTGAYYLCRRDFFELMEVGRLTLDWFRILVGDTIDWTEVRGWRKTGRPEQLNPSFTELKIVRCIINGPELEQIYTIAERYKSSLVNKTGEFRSSTFGEMTTKSKFSDATKEADMLMDMPKASIVDDILEDTYEKMESAIVYSESAKESQPSSSGWQQTCRIFEFAEIQKATQNFDESLVIGQGGFGKVYKGTIVYGSTLVIAAIKRRDSMSGQGATEFWAEVEMFSKWRHCYLVSLIGYCNDGKEMILVYEHMPNGTLDYHLHHLNTPLSWLQRLNICIDAARGLDYLHTGMGIHHGVIHRDIKSSNIFLNESWAAKISDFGLSKIIPRNQSSTHVNTDVKGTFGYLDPSYYNTGKLTRKSDVYAFGVVLFEVLCRRRAVDGSIDHEEHWGLAKWAQDSIRKGHLKHVIDSDLRDQISTKCLKKFAQIADHCLHSHPEKRPTMAEVVVGLESLLTL